MNVLVLGSGGMAGHVVSLYLRENGFIVDTLSGKNKLDEATHIFDVTDSKEFKNFLNSKQYDIIVNCIAILVKQSEERKDLAVHLNAYLPLFLEEYYQDTETKVIHLSTDSVFSSKNPPYKEDSAYDAEGFYDRSKALGEIINAKDVTFRMSLIGPDMRADGLGLFNWFCRQRGEISGYTNVIWNGITTVELAKAIKAAIEQDLTGLYHLVPKHNISKYNLLQLFKDVLDYKDIEIKPTEGLALDRTLINTRDDFHHQIPDYATMITEMGTWIKDHPNIYRHYER